jgi:hypothetical protein
MLDKKTKICYNNDIVNKEKHMKIKRKINVKQRNPLVVLTLFRKAGKHQKTNKALRREFKSDISHLTGQY